MSTSEEKPSGEGAPPTAAPAETAAPAVPGTITRKPWWRRFAWGEVLVLLIAVAVVGRFAVRYRSASRGPGGPGGPSGGGAEFNRPMSNDVRAFLAPITEGSEVGGATVVHISPVVRGMIRLELRKGSDTIQLAIVRASPAHPPPGGGHYVVYIWEHPPGPHSNQVSYALSNALRRRAAELAPAGLEVGEH